MNDDTDPDDIPNDVFDAALANDAASPGPTMQVEGADWSVPIAVGTLRHVANVVEARPGVESIDLSLSLKMKTLPPDEDS